MLNPTTRPPLYIEADTTAAAFPTTALGTIDSNYYSTDSLPVAVTRLFHDGTWQPTNYTLSAWQTFSSQDAHSKNQLFVTDTLYQNRTAAQTTPAVDSSLWRTMDGVSVTSLTLAPFTSQLLRAKDTIAVDNNTYFINYSPAVKNGGLETAGSPFSGWSTYTDGTGDIADTSEAYEGTHAARLRNFGSSCELYMNNALDLGNGAYTCSMYIKATAGTPTITVMLGGVTEVQAVTTSWAKYTFAITSTGDNTLLIFTDGRTSTIIVDAIRLYPTP
jgi:hypothetical protein